MYVEFSVYRQRASGRICWDMNNTNVTSWSIDPVHTTIGFSVRHMMVANVRGEFQRVTGKVLYDAKRPAATQVQAEVPADSVSTREPQRDAHLRSPDFFDVERHPTLSFRSTGVRFGGAGGLELVGDLMIRGTTREVTLAVTEVSGEQRDHNGKTRMGASAIGKIKRSEFGITYNKVLEATRVAVGDEVTLLLDLSLLKDEAV